MNLNLGSYRYPLPGWHNVDIEQWPGVDEIVDLNRLPWPWEDGMFYQVRAVDIVEHLGKLTKVEIIRELARVTKTGGKVIVRVPCGSHAWACASIQHAHLFQYNSFEESYAQPWFKCTRVRVGLSDYGKRSFKINRFWRTMCKYFHVVQVLEFELERNEVNITGPGR